MDDRPTIGRTAIVLASLAIVLLDLLTAAVTATGRPPPGDSALDAQLAETGTEAPLAPWVGPTPAAAPAAGAPARLRLPAIGVDAPVEGVGLTAAGAMAAPRDARDVGWYAAGVRPGQPGDAVLDGCSDRDGGAGALAGLGSLRVGDDAVVLYAGGTAVPFRVVRVAVYPAGEPPSDLFGRTGPARLSLLTCSTDPAAPAAVQRLVVDAEATS